MAFLEGIAGYAERKDNEKYHHKTESGQRHSPNGLMTFGLNANGLQGNKPPVHEEEQAVSVSIEHKPAPLKLKEAQKRKTPQAIHAEFFL